MPVALRTSFPRLPAVGSLALAAVAGLLASPASASDVAIDVRSEDRHTRAVAREADDAAAPARGPNADTLRSDDPQFPVSDDEPGATADASKTTAEPKTDQAPPDSDSSNSEMQQPRLPDAAEPPSAGGRSRMTDDDWQRAEQMLDAIETRRAQKPPARDRRTSPRPAGASSDRRAAASPQRANTVPRNVAQSLTDRKLSEPQSRYLNTVIRMATAETVAMSDEQAEEATARLQTRVRSVRIANALGKMKEQAKPLVEAAGPDREAIEKVVWSLEHAENALRNRSGLVDGIGSPAALDQKNDARMREHNADRHRELVQRHEQRVQAMKREEETVRRRIEKEIEAMQQKFKAAGSELERVQKQVAKGKRDVAQMQKRQDQLREAEERRRSTAKERDQNEREQKAKQTEPRRQPERTKRAGDRKKREAVEHVNRDAGEARGDKAKSEEPKCDSQTSSDGSGEPAPSGSPESSQGGNATGESPKACDPKEGCDARK